MVELQLIADGDTWARHSLDLQRGPTGVFDSFAYGSTQVMIPLEHWPMQDALAVNVVQGVDVLVTTGDLSALHADEWVCLKSLTGSQLLSHTADSPGWSITLDVRADNDGKAIIRTVHVLRHTDAAPEDAPTSGSDESSTRVIDAADADETIAALSSRSFLVRSLTGQVEACETRLALGRLLSGAQSEVSVVLEVRGPPQPAVLSRAPH